MFPCAHFPSRTLLLAVALLPRLVGAAEIPAAEDSFFGDLPIVLSVSRLSQPLSEAPGAVTILDSESIRLSGAREIPDLFRLVPGFQVGNTDARPRLYYHGVLEEFGQHMQVLVDGRSVYSPFHAGGINWNNLPLALEDIERIEVTRGSNAAAYGANAFLGMVNIITKHPSQSHQGWSVSQSLGAGINDSLVRYAGPLDNGNYRLTAGRRSDPGFGGTRSERDIRHFTFRSDWRQGNQDEFQLQMGGTDSLGGTGRPDFLGDQPRTTYSNSDFLLLRWQHHPDPESEFQLTYYHTDERSKNNFPYPLTGTVYLPLNATVDFGGVSSRDSLEAQHTLSPGDNLRLAWGGELRHDAVKSQAIYAQPGWLGLDLVRMFGNLEWRATPNILVNAGASVERSSLSGTSASPRLAINYHFTPEQTLRAGVSRATRAPSIFEERANIRYFSLGMPLVETTHATGGLSPERITSHEIGYFGDFRTIGVMTDVRLFQESITGLASRETYSLPLNDWLAYVAGLPLGVQNAVLAQMAAIRGGPFSQPADYVNSNRTVTIRGLEYQVKYQATPLSQFLFNQTFINISSPSPYYYQSTGDRQAAPRHSASLTFIQKFPQDCTFAATVSRVGEMYWAGSPAPKVVPAYNRVDVRLSHGFHVGNTKGEAAVLVQNAGGNYADTDLYYVFSRRIFGTLSLEF